MAARDADLVVTDQLLKGVFESSVEPHVLLRAVRDNDGEIVDFSYIEANHAALRHLHLTRDQLLGATVTTLYPAPAAVEVIGMCRSVLAGDAPVVLDEWSYSHQNPGTERYYDIRGVGIDAEIVSFSWRDVTERRSTRAALTASEERFRALVHATPSGMLVQDGRGRILEVNPAAAEILGLTRDNMLGRSSDSPAWRTIRPDGSDVAPDDHPAMRALATGRPVTDESLGVCNPAGVVTWLNVMSVPFTRPEDPASPAVLTSIIDVTAAVEKQLALQQQAHTDELTGLLNRGELLHRLTGLLDHPPRTGEKLAVLFGDLDGLKRINDTRGHDVGDILVTTAADRVRGALRQDDVIARIGGDEIVAVLTGIHDLAGATAVAQKVGQAVAAPIDIAGSDPIVSTISIGVALALPGDDAESLIRRADANMYVAKREGGGAVVAQVSIDP